jgi:hypothetical protein
MCEPSPSPGRITTGEVFTRHMHGYSQLHKLSERLHTKHLNAGRNPPLLQFSKLHRNHQIHWSPKPKPTRDPRSTAGGSRQNQNPPETHGLRLVVLRLRKGSTCYNKSTNTSTNPKHNGHGHPSPQDHTEPQVCQASQAYYVPYNPRGCANHTLPPVDTITTAREITLITKAVLLSLLIP